MKKVVLQINSVSRGSTGTIMLGISSICQNTDIANITAGGGLKNQPFKGDIQIGTFFGRRLHSWMSKLFGYHGCYSYFATKKFLKKVSKIQPDIIHLHNIHGWYINLPALFHYIKKHNIRVVWTLHDCWSFTGQCAYFTMAKCNKWKTGCHNCTQLRAYPMTCVDRTKSMWKLKRKWFTGVQDMTIVTPSQWLADLVKESYLKEYPVKVINNGIDLSVFKPILSDFRQKYGLGEKYILLGVADGWGERKGLDVFVELSKRLDPDKFQIVLVGTSDELDKQLPENILSIHHTESQQELAEIYTAADLFVNPTREENYPTVNMESIACGTPVLTFRTGGSPEMLDDTCGAVVDCDDIDTLEREIIRIYEDKPFTVKECVEHAKCFNAKERYVEYKNIYWSSK